MWNKTDFKINGEHAALGQELSTAEFKGYTVAELESIKNLIKDMKQDYIRESSEFRNSCLAHRQEIFGEVRKNSEDIKSLNYFRAQALTISAVVSLVAGTIVSWFLGGN